MDTVARAKPVPFQLGVVFIRFSETRHFVTSIQKQIGVLVSESIELV